MPRTPRSRFYDARVYAWVVDPFVSGLHRMVAELVEPGSKLNRRGGTNGVARAAGLTRN